MDFFSGKNIFITGHTGFKGSWLSIWLHSLGATITGYALDPPTKPNLFELAKINELLSCDIRADVRDLQRLTAEISKTKPEIIFHLAAQPLVRESYRSPVDTYATNVMGTVNLLEAVRNCPTVRAVIIVTSDKCYENREWPWGYRENEPMGGYDPYSSSKGCAELVTAAYRRSFFNPPTIQQSNGSKFQGHSCAVATARSGNVIGGGDWAADRLVPDCIRALLSSLEIVIRNPHATRPWQHVLEPLSGYLLLAEKLYIEGSKFAGPWNFGPFDDDARSVERIVERLCALWGEHAGYRIDACSHPHETNYLKLDISKARAELGWQPSWSLETTLEKIIEWMHLYRSGGAVSDICLTQIEEYQRKN